VLDLSEVGSDSGGALAETNRRTGDRFRRRPDDGQQAFFNRIFTAVAFGEFNQDGRLDVFVTNDTLPNSLFRNRGDGTFEEVAVQVGVAYNGDGKALGGIMKRGCPTLSAQTAGLSNAGDSSHSLRTESLEEAASYVADSGQIVDAIMVSVAPNEVDAPVCLAHDVRDQIVDFVRPWSEKDRDQRRRFIEWLEVAASKLCPWREQ
jgi:hypothetical protein